MQPEQRSVLLRGEPRPRRHLDDGAGVRPGRHPANDRSHPGPHRHDGTGTRLHRSAWPGRTESTLAQGARADAGQGADVEHVVALYGRVIAMVKTRMFRWTLAATLAIAALPL